MVLTGALIGEDSLASVVRSEVGMSWAHADRWSGAFAAKAIDGRFAESFAAESIAPTDTSGILPPSAADLVE